jgi:flagellar assembly protein FliH
MEMGAPAKYLFDVDFAAGTGSRRAGSAISLAEHALKLAEAETAAHRQGYADAQADARLETDRCMAGAMERIAANLDEANRALKSIETRLECEAVEVAVAVARKLAPALIAREPFAEISALASGCFRELVSAPHIAVRVNDALYASAREKLEDIVRANHFQGRLVVLAESDIAIGDCRIEWADGGVNRDSAVADAAIGAAVTSYIGAQRNLADTPAVSRRSDNE